MSVVKFIDGKPHENDPGFSTRLNFTIDRVKEILFTKRVSRIYVPVIGLFLGTVTFLLYNQKINPDKAAELILGIFGSFFFGYFGLIITVYWNIDSVYGRKWALIFEKYYEINQLPAGEEQDLHFCNLWIDAITIGMWADDAFASSLHEHLVLGVEHVDDEYREGLKIKLHMNALTKKQGRHILRKFADSLDKESPPSKPEIIKSLPLKMDDYILDYFDNTG